MYFKNWIKNDECTYEWLNKDNSKSMYLFKLSMCNILVNSKVVSKIYEQNATISLIKIYFF